MAVSDGADGAFVFLAEPGYWRLIAQRVTADGVPAPGWPDTGLVLPNEHWDQIVALQDGGGGAYVAASGSRKLASISIHHLAGPGGVLSTWSPPLTAQVVEEQAPILQPTNPTLPGFLFPSLALDEEGLTVGWLNMGLYWRAKAMRVELSGTASPGWPVNGLGLSDRVVSGVSVVVCSDGAGGLFAAWGHLDTGTLSHDLRVHHVRHDAQLDTLWPAAGIVAADASRSPRAPTLAPDGDGGFILVWQDARNGFEQTFAQRHLANGTIALGWPAEGLLLSPSRSEAGTVRLWGDFAVPYGSVAPDRQGGVFVTWTDFGNPVGEIAVQHLRSDGTTAWPFGGTPVSLDHATQRRPVIVPGSSNDVFVAWEETRPGSGFGVYLQRLIVSGSLAPGWPTNGLEVCNEIGDQVFPTIAPDGSGAAMVAWLDHRTSVPTVYAARVTADGVVPTQLALAGIEVTIERVILTWQGGNPAGLARVYRRTASEPWSHRGTIGTDGNGRLVYQDEEVVPGGRYAYRLGLVTVDRETFTPESWVDIPIGSRLELHGMTPNPTTSELVVALTLPAVSPAARLELLDLSGRRLRSRIVTAVPAGRHSVHFGSARDLAPGIYWVRLTQGTETRLARGCVIR